jgi:hypothetical protein
MEVSAFDVNSEVLESGQNNIDLAFKVLDALGTPECSIAPVRLTSELEDCVDGADLVIENVPEDIGVKLPLFKELEKLVSAECVLASDSSGIPISRLQDGSDHPGRFIGMHWSNPPHIIPMIEVIAGKKTDMQVVDWLMKMIRDLGLIPVLVKKDVPGFVENRVLYALLRECVDLVERGVIDPVDLDTCVSWGIGYKLSVIGPMTPRSTRSNTISEQRIKNTIFYESRDIFFHKYWDQTKISDHFHQPIDNLHVSLFASNNFNHGNDMGWVRPMHTNKASRMIRSILKSRNRNS